MKEIRVAKRYAQALFSAAMEKNALDAVESDLKLLQKEYQEVAEFRQVIDSPVISNQKKQEIFSEAFKGRLDDVSFSFISLLIQKNREALLEPIYEKFNELLDEHRGILRGEVRSAVPLSEQQISRLVNFLNARTGQKVILTQRIDKGVLGGFVVRLKDLIIDTSLRNQLERLNEMLAGSM